MAVEIPVVVDIEGAFQDAARRAPKAMEPLKKAIDGLNEDLSVFREMLNSVPVGSKDFQLIAKEIQNISQAMDVANAEFVKYSTNEGSIKQLSNELQFLNDQWSKMGKSQKFTSTGELTSEASKLYENYKRVTAELEKQGKSLSQMAQNEKNAAEQAKRRAESEAKERERINALNKAKIQQRRDENTILQMEGKTIQVLQQQQRILTERLAKTRIGTEEYGRMRMRLAEVTAELGKANGGVNTLTNSLQRQSGILGRLASAATAYFSVYSLIRFVKGIRDVTGELEYQRVALGRLLQDVSYGNYLFERTKQAAIESPFRIKDLVTYTKQLAAYRIEQTELFDTTKRLADISAGLGVDMNRLILAFGQVRAASVLRGQELRQFTEAGIPLVELLAEKFTDLKGEMVSTGDVFELISKRAVPFSKIAEIFEDLTSKGGMFYDMQKKQAETLKGRWEKLKDAYDVALQSVGDTSTFQNINDVVLKVLTGLANNLRLVVKVVDAAAISWAAYNAILLITGTRAKAVATYEQKIAISQALRTKTINGLIVKIMGQAAAEKALTAAQTQATIGTNMLTRALGRLKVALMTNPWLVAGTAILGVVLALNRFKDASNDATEAVNASNRAIDDVHAAKKHSDRITDLTEQYERLAQKTERNSAENETFARTIKKISAEFPEYSKRLNDDNLSLEERLKLVQDINKEEADRLKNLIDSKEETLSASRTRLSEAQSDLDIKEQAKDDATKYYNELVAERNRLESEGAKGSGFWGKFFLGESDYDRVLQFVKAQEKAMDDATKAYNEQKELVDGLLNSVEKLDEELHGTKEEVEAGTKAWKDAVKKIISDKVDAGAIEIFSPSDIDQFESVLKFSKELKRVQDEYTQSLKTNQELRKTSTDLTRDKIKSDITSDEQTLKMIEAITAALGIVFKTTSTRGSDTRLSDLKKQISEITNAYKKFLELRKYMSDESAKNEIGILFPQLKDFDPTLDAVTNRIKDLMKGYKGPKDKVFLDMQNAIDTEISNLKFDALKKTLTDDLKRISEDIKRSETARNFYNDILGLTGDEKLAASLSMEVYGQTGSDFKDRVQKELYQALNSIDKSKIENSTLQRLIADVTTLDWDDLEANLDKVPEEVQNLIKRLRADTEKFNADLAKSLLQSLENAKSYGAKRVEIAQKTAKRLAEIESLGVDDSTKENLRKQSAKKEAEEVAKLQYEAFRDSPLYIEMFENLEGASTKMLQNMRDSLIALKGEWRNLSPRELKEMQSKIDEIDKQLATRNPFTSLINSIKAYRKMIKGRSREDVDVAAAMSTQFANEQKRLLEIANANYQAVLGRADATQEEKDAAKEELDIQAAMTDTAVDQAEAAQDVASEYRRAAKAILDAANGLEKWAGYVSDSLDGIGEIVSTFASDDVADTFNIVSSGINKTMGGLATTAVNAARLFAGDLTAIPGLIKGIGETIGGIFGTAQQLRIKKANKDIKEQDKLLEDLEYQYGRLQVAMEKSFGSDYITNYNQQLDNLAAKQAAYLKQAEAERSKGKKADEEKIKGYENSARDAADQIRDMQTQLAEYFSGTDLTSAAKDFANAWIEAYKEFGSVTDAMSEKFNDMIQEMVENSVAAQVMQQLLKPIFDEIDRRAREGGELSTEDIAAISKMATEQIPAINDAMTTLMNSLQAAGYDFRQQPGQFTGISRNIANATEESITGLAAGINTQNFYMSMINQNVAAILAVISGGAVPTEGAPSVQFNNELALQRLSGIDDKLATLLNQLDKVIKPMSVPAQYYVSVRQ